MKRYYYHIRRFLLQVLVLIIAFSTTRILFHLFNKTYFGEIDVLEILAIYTYGLKYDLVVISIINAIIFIPQFVPGDFKESRIFQKIILGYFIVVNSIALGLNIIDTKYFDFTNKRSTTDLFHLMQTSEDVWDLIPLFIKDYWYLLLILIALVYSVYKNYPKFRKAQSLIEKIKIKDIFLQSCITIFLTGLLFLGSRGSIGLKPLRIINAAEVTSAKNIPIVLSTPFTVLKSVNKKGLEQKEYYSEKEVSGIFNPIKEFSGSIEFEPKNVVIIIMESFANEYMGTINNSVGYMPFLDSLINESLFFPNGFANGKRSIEAVPSILAGLPSLMDNPYLTSTYSTNKMRSIATILKEKDYHTSFFHGGKNGTMGFDKFVKFADFDEYYGVNEYPGKNDYDGGWGVYDEPFFKFFADKLTSFEEPFLSSIFSLSSHHPYHIPEKYKNKFPEGTLDIHESIGYADYALKTFFNYAKQFEWYENTLFVITADHTAQLETDSYNNIVGNYRIPMFYYCPGDNLQGMDSSITQQIDIVPSVLDYLHYKGTELFFGNSVFNTKRKPYTINFNSGIYQVVKREYVYNFDGSKPLALYNFNEDVLLKNNLLEIENELTNEMDSILKAFIQVYNNRVITNSLVVDEE